MRSRVLYISAGGYEFAHELARLLNEVPSFIHDHVETLQQAKARLRSETYDVIITDADLTDGTWLNVMHMIRESVIEPKVILTDPSADDELRAKALSCGVYGVIAQPFDSCKVLGTLTNACSRETWMYVGR
jgi:DNA-binding NtrC family response regulator